MKKLAVIALALMAFGCNAKEEKAQEPLASMIISCYDGGSYVKVPGTDHLYFNDLPIQDHNTIFTESTTTIIDLKDIEMSNGQVRSFSVRVPTDSCFIAYIN